MQAIQANLISSAGSPVTATNCGISHERHISEDTGKNRSSDISGGKAGNSPPTETLSTGDLAGIGIAAAAVGIAMIVAAYLVIVLRKGAKKDRKSHAPAPYLDETVELPSGARLNGPREVGEVHAHDRAELSANTQPTRMEDAHPVTELSGGWIGHEMRDAINQAPDRSTSSARSSQ